jgi:hypothetical protein
MNIRRVVFVRPAAETTETIDVRSAQQELPRAEFYRRSSLQISGIFVAQEIITAPPVDVIPRGVKDGSSVRFSREHRCSS